MNVWYMYVCMVCMYVCMVCMYMYGYGQPYKHTIMYGSVYIDLANRSRGWGGVAAQKLVLQAGK